MKKSYLRSFFIPTTRYLHDLFRDKTFIVLTLLGNSFISLTALIFYYLEKGKNNQIHSLIDALWFSFSTVCTVGYGDITPQTTAGRILGIFMMLIGSALFATFTALFAHSFLNAKFKVFQDDVKKMGQIEKQIDLEEDQIRELVKEMRGLIIRFENRPPKE